MITYETDRVFMIKGVMPHVNSTDKYIVLFFVFFLSILRIIISGADTPYTIKWSSITRKLIVKYKLCNPNRVSKMSESIWYFFWHTFSFIYTLKILLQEYGSPENPGWVRYFVRDLKGIWFFAEDLNLVKKNQASWPMLNITMETRILLLMCTGFWISSLIFINWETRRTDTNIFKFHHITTTVLLILSYIYNFHRISLFVIFLHDIPDVFLYLTKIYAYVIKRNEILLGTLFVTYGSSHFITRFLLLTKFIVYPLLMNFDNFEYSGGTIKYLWDFPGGIICPAAILVLMIMNGYWLREIILLAKKIALGEHELADPRED